MEVAYVVKVTIVSKITVYNAFQNAWSANKRIHAYNAFKAMKLTVKIDAKLYVYNFLPIKMMKLVSVFL